MDAQNVDDERPRAVVADDEVHIVDVLAILLHELGFAVVKAYNGAQALEAIRQAPTALVLSDVMMPKLRGDELVRQLKADRQTAAIPVILLSSLPQDGQMDSGAAAFVRKPFDFEVLEALIKRLRIGKQSA